MREKIIYGMALLAAILLARNLHSTFLVLPDEANQGMIYRIMFFHIPAAWTALLACAVALVASVMFLITKDFKYDAMGVKTNSSVDEVFYSEVFKYISQRISELDV